MFYRLVNVRIFLFSPSTANINIDCQWFCFHPRSLPIVCCIGTFRYLCSIREAWYETTGTEANRIVLKTILNVTLGCNFPFWKWVALYFTVENDWEDHNKFFWYSQPKLEVYKWLVLDVLGKELHLFTGIDS